MIGAFRGATWFLAASALGACGGTLDAGSDRAAEGPVTTDTGLPVDGSNRVILSNDGATDNWQGEFALLLVATGLTLDGLIINDSGAWPDLESNVSDWQAMSDAASQSGIRGFPAVTSSDGPPLIRPDSGEIDDTSPNRSAGAQLIVEAALDISEPPLVVVTGGRLTDVADAYLMEPDIADRIVVVSSLGQLSDDGATMGVPNGEMDPWADTIVVERMPYVQVSAYYNQLDDVPDTRVAELPQNTFGDWIAGKHSEIFDIEVAADQVALLAVALPGFAQEVERVQMSGTEPSTNGDTPKLSVQDGGDDWLVTKVDGDLATRTFWSLLSEVWPAP